MKKFVQKFLKPFSKMTRTPQSSYTCQICNKTIDEANALTHVKAEEYLLDLIRKDHPEWKKEKGACQKCIEYYRELINKAKI